MYDVAALGELLIDFTCLSTDADGYPTMAAHPGGAPANYLAALTKFGAKTAMIGKVGSTEVDFVAEKQGVYVYFQVTADMTAQETFERELRPLNLIRDNYEKIVLTNDRLTLGNYNGIQVKNLTDWLLHI